MPDHPLQLQTASSTDRTEIGALLAAADLPPLDDAQDLSRFVVARRAGRVVGAIGAEICGEDALLRSLVVAEAERRSGIGTRLVGALDERASAWGVVRWWLLTMTAESYFRRLGFHSVPRSTAPAGIAQTTEFRGVCPSVAACLTARAGLRPAQ